MPSEHTAEPWYVGKETAAGCVWVYAHGDPLAEPNVWWTGFRAFFFGKKDTRELTLIQKMRGESAEANAGRVVACVNACKGINPKAVPDLLETAKTFVAVLDHGGQLVGNNAVDLVEARLESPGAVVRSVRPVLSG